MEKKNSSEDIKKLIIETQKKVYANYQRQQIYEPGHTDGKKLLPNRDEVISIIRELRRLMFPGFFGTENTAILPLENFAGTSLASIYEKLYTQIKIGLMFSDKENINIEENAKEISMQFIEALPDIQELIWGDVEAELMGDPAAGSMEEVIFSYPGLYAIFVYRLAHVLYEKKVPLIPRMMTEHAHGKTGIDINPGACIGKHFFIDHGTGIVIGETTIIGDNVKIYQGVTLGALSTRKGQELSGSKRHPTIEDNVVIYANTTILGGDTVVGRNSVVAGNTFIIQSIPENTKVSAYMPELKLKSL